MVVMGLGGRHVFVFDMFDMFGMFRKRSGQYLHVSQGEHLLRLLERNLDNTVIIVWWWGWRRWWRLIVNGWHTFMVTRIILSVMSWWRLCGEI